ncbi:MULTISPECIES: lamin tail domain-containing protein [Bacteria]|uniref:lamin tail domain-containing protein n=1 Tax=Bacteria TaxID=2 RepID=UPI003C7CA866
MPVPAPRRIAALCVAAVAVAVSVLVTSPARAADPSSSRVVVNEIVYDDPQGGPDAIELHNPSSAPVDLSGWSVQDDKRDPAKTGVLPAGTVLAPGAFLVLMKDGRPLGFPFGLGKGDEVVLLDAAGVVIDGYAYTGTAPLGDWSRCGVDASWAPATAITLGASNVCEPVVEPAEPGSVLLNEIDSGPADAIELINPGDEAFDLSGHEVRDNSDDHRWFFAPGTSIGAGERLVVEASTLGADAAGATQEFQAAIGIGGSDAIRLLSPDGVLLDQYSWTRHPAIDGDEAAASYARCPDATGSWGLARVTLGAANDCVPPAIAVNEVESNGDASDWVEVVNTGTEAVDLSGWTLMDNDPIGHAKDVTPVAAGIVLAPGAFFVFDGALHFGFGLGADDRATIRDAVGMAVAEYAWTTHAAGTWARCGDGVAFIDVATATKGVPNSCGGDPGNPGNPGGEPAALWPGGGDVAVVDEAAMFLKDSSGLDTQETADGTFLWAVDNGTGTFWKLAAHADGSVAFADGWEKGKRARFARDAGNPAAKGPDAEGISVGGDGRIYIASERDNGNKGVNQNTVLALDPDAPGPDVVAEQEWDLTASLPQVAANTGIEAVEWVPDGALAGRLVDQRTGSGYDPADYPAHGDGLFFVAVEDDGVVYAYALGADGSIAQVAAIDPGLGGVMALDYDTVLGELWAVCDNGCDGAAARIAFTGGEPAVSRLARPSGMPNLNNEGFATAPASLGTAVSAAGTTRPVWWFADGEQPAALRAGTLPGPAVGGPGAPEPGGPGTGGSAGGAPGTTDQGAGPSSALAVTGPDEATGVLVPIGMALAALGATTLLVRRLRRTGSDVR